MRTSIMAVRARVTRSCLVIRSHARGCAGLRGSRRLMSRLTGMRWGWRVIPGRVALRKILPYDRHSSSYSKGFAANPDDRAELISFVFAGIHETEDPVDHGLVDAHGDELSRPLSSFDILIQHFVQNIIVGQAVAVFLAGPQLGGG